MSKVTRSAVGRNMGVGVYRGISLVVVLFENEKVKMEEVRRSNSEKGIISFSDDSNNVGQPHSELPGLNSPRESF